MRCFCYTVSHMRFSRVFSAQPHALSGHIVAIETDISRGLHSFSVVGLASKAVDEAKDRISSAIKNSGFKSPKSENHKIVIALSPAELRKEGSYFDVAMAIGYLLSAEAIDAHTDNTLFLGELALNGEVQPIRGTLPLVQAAVDKGFKSVFVPKQNKREATLIEGITVYPVSTLREVVEHITGNSLIIPAENTNIHESQSSANFVPDFKDIKGQELGKRGLEIAAAGGHNVILYGPPGTGKTTLARALTGILPALTRDQSLEVTGIHSIAGILGDETLLVAPPFRAPHHTASHVAIIGGGAHVRPGEVTLAHHGVLFLDEFPEFDKRVIESLRQPIEDRLVYIVRAQSRATFPTNFMLIAAMNPPDSKASHAEKERYKKKLSGPIMDRIDIWLPVEHVNYQTLGSETAGESTETIRNRVYEARKRQRDRFASLGSRAITNSDMDIHEMNALELSSTTKAVLEQSAEKMNLSPRAYHRILKLARTIADLDQSDAIHESHVLEALQYRQNLPWI